MKPSKYIDAFNRLASDGSSTFILADSCLIVEKIPEDEMTTKSGIIIAEPQSYKGTLQDSKPVWVRVVAVGAGYYDDETGEDIPLGAKPGDIGLVGHISVQWFSVFGDLQDYDPQTLGITREEEIKLKFHGEAGFERAFALLNGSKGTEGTADETGGEGKTSAEGMEGIFPSGISSEIPDGRRG